jgi:hypothetical protein
MGADGRAKCKMAAGSGVEVELHSFASNHGETERRDKDDRPWH